MAAGPRQALVLGDGRILSTVLQSGLTSSYFFVQGVAESQVRSFGSVTRTRLLDSIRMLWRGRDVALAAADTFWAAPVPSVGAGYVLERWTATGQLTLRIERKVPWFPMGSDLPGKTALPPVAAGGRRPRPVTRPASYIRELYTDHAGLLYVYVTVVTDRWKPIADMEEYASVFPRFIDTYIEVIDPVAGRVIASEGPLRNERTSRPFTQIAGARLAFETFSIGDGLLGAVIRRLDLLPRNAQ